VRFFVQKTRFSSKIKKFAAKFFNRGIPNRSKFTNNLDPRDTTHARREQTERMNPSAEACCMIEDWDPKHLDFI